MRRTQRLVSAVLLLAVLAAGACAAPILDPARISDRTLDNGFRLILKDEDQWGLAAAALYVRAGSAYESEEQIGAAHLLEHLLFEATDQRDEQRVGPAIEALGGYVNAGTTRDFTRIDIIVASQYLPEALEMLAQTVFEPRLSQAAVAREREIVARELIDRSDTAGGVLDDLLWAASFEQHPYGRPIGGTAEQVGDLTVDDLMQFYARFYVPANMALVVVGDVEPDEVAGRVEELFGSRPQADFQAPELPAEPPLQDVRVVAETRPSQATIVSFAWHAPEVENFDEVCAMDLIYTVLGEGQLGRLHAALNEEGLAVASSCDYLTQRDPGLMIVTAVCERESETDVRAAILNEIRRLREEPLTEEELAEAKRVLRIGYAFTNEAYSDQAGSLGFYEALGDHTLAIEYVDRVNALTAEQVQQVAQKYLDPDAYTLAIIRPEPRPGEMEEARLPCADSPVQG
ncbi:MAG: M16 family metallopeptidase [Armatimonadota bacterium]